MIAIIQMFVGSVGEEERVVSDGIERSADWQRVEQGNAMCNIHHGHDAVVIADT